MKKQLYRLICEEANIKKIEDKIRISEDYAVHLVYDYDYDSLDYFWPDGTPVMNSKLKKELDKQF